MKNGPGPVVVFGARGFIGGAIVEHLIARGLPVTVPTATAGGRVDVTRDIDEIRRAIGDAQVVVNAAGRAHLHSSDPADFWPVNASGARNVARAVSLSPCVERLVHVSSVSVGAGGVEPPAASHAPFTAYGASKAAGEVAVAAEMADSEADLVIVRPVGVGGATSPGAWGSIRRRVEGGKRIPVPTSGVRHEVVEIENVVAFLARSIEGNVASGVYTLTGAEPVTVEAYARSVGKGLNLEPKIVRVPSWILEAALSSVDGVERLTKPAHRVDQMLTTLLRQRPLTSERCCD